MAANLEAPPVTPLHEGAIRYYDGACAHCHGAYGSAYTAGFFTKYDLKQLRKSIEDMATGPGQSPLDAEGLRAQVAFHQAIIARLPFLDWTARDGAKLSGEVTRKASVRATVGGANVPVTVTGSRWALVLPGDAKPTDLSLSATVNRRTTIWSPTEDPFSTPSKWPPTPVK